MNKFIEEYDIPPYLFQALNIFFALLVLFVLYKLYKHFKGKQ
jgi:dipeptide/tripeptide permease